jgi:drug/metabolite transporter (DMT)-like permease
MNAGLAAAILSSALGGTAIVATRYLSGTLDPITMGAFRFGGGFLVLLALTMAQPKRWPARTDWAGVAGLGLLFFGMFPILFNAALIYTTAARAALALSTLPLLTMTAAAMLRVEALTLRKSIGVLVAMAGVAVALASSLHDAPAGAWRGDLIMVAAAGCMALYNVWSRPFVARSTAIAFAASGMAVGASALVLLTLVSGRASAFPQMSGLQWSALAYLAVIGGALIFYLWAYALGRTSPTLVAVSVAVNPISAGLLAVPMLGESVSASLAAGLVGVTAGIGIAAWPKRAR